MSAKHKVEILVLVRVDGQVFGEVKAKSTKSLPEAANELEAVTKAIADVMRQNENG